MAPMDFDVGAEVQYHPDGTTSAGMVGPALGIIGAVVGCTAVGFAWDLWAARRSRQTEKAPKSAGVGGLRGWVVGMLLSSYALLLPGLVSHLFVARTDLIMFGFPMNLAEYDDTMVSLVAHLVEEHMILGAALVALYAMVIPVLKILLLVLGQCLQRSGRVRDTRRARMCILAVQAISKWASPDLFAYILLLNLMRGLDEPPSLRSGMALDLGFTCFSVFCVGSTISSLGIQVPALSSEEEASSKIAPVAKPRIGLRCAAALVALLALLFSGLLAQGLIRPSMSLHIDLPLLYTVRPDLLDFQVVIEYLHVDELLQDEVGVFDSIRCLARWSAQGEVTSALALFLYAGCALLLPILDMCLILATTLLKLQNGSREDVGMWSSRAMAVSRQLRKMSMLDVSVMGSLVVVASLRTLREKGVVIDVCSGAFLLLAAEVCHHAAARVALYALAPIPSRELPDVASVEAAENADVGVYGSEACGDMASSEDSASMPGEP